MAEIKDWQEAPIDDWQEVKPESGAGGKRSYTAAEIPGQALKNFLPNLLENVSNIPKGIVGLSDIAKLAQPAGWLQLSIENKDPVDMLMKLGPSIYNSYVEKYRGWDNIKRTAAERPADLFADIAVLVSGGAGIAGKTLGPASRVTSGLKIAGTAMNDVMALGIPQINSLLKRMPWAGKGLKESSQKLQAVLNEEGIELPAAAVTGSTGQAGLTKTLSNMPTGAGTIEEEVSNAFAQMADQSRRVIAAKGLNVTPFQAGGVARSGEGIAFQKAKEKGNALYNAATRVGKKAEIVLDETSLKFREIIENDEFKLLPGEVQKYYKKTFEKIPEKRSLIVDQFGKESITPEIIKPVTNTLDQVDELRKAINKHSGYERVYPDNVQRLFRDIRNTIDSDVINSTKTSNPVAAKLFEKARSFQHEEIFGKFKGVDEFKQMTMGETLARTDPSLMLREMNTVTGLNQVKKVMLNDNYWDVVRRGKIAELIEPAFKEVDTINGKMRIIDGDKLTKAIYRDLAPEYRKSLFKPDELDALDRVIAPSQAMKTLERIGGSQSGTPKGMFYGRMLELSPPGAGGLFGYVIGGPTGALIGSAAGYMTPYAVSKFITSNAGKKYLIEGVKLSPKAQQEIRFGTLTGAQIVQQKAQLP